MEEFLLIGGATTIGLIASVVLSWKWLFCIREFDYHQEMLSVLNKDNIYCPKKTIKSKVQQSGTVKIVQESDAVWGLIKYYPIPMYIKLCPDYDTLRIYTFFCFRHYVSIIY
jgi:dihydroorotate dehydrogenase